MEKTIDSARENRDPTAALLSSGLPNKAEDKVLTALKNAGLNQPVESLMGSCQRNAVALRDELRQRDFEAVAVRGWVTDGENHIVPRDIGEAEAHGVVHWWVEARVFGEWYTFDLATNLPDERWGDLYVGPRPADYRPHTIDPGTMDAIRDEYGLEPPRGIFDESL